MTYVIVNHRDGRQQRVELTDLPLRFGRSAECHVILADDGEVSREHAEVRLLEDGQMLVRDLGSKNGTLVDGHILLRGDSATARESVRIGSHELTINRAGTPPTRAPATPARGETAVGDVTQFPSSKGLQLSHDRLLLLMELTRQIGKGTFERRRFLDEALAECCELLKFERGMIALRTPRGEPEMPITRNVDPGQISRTLINRALVDGVRTVVNDLEADLPGNITDSLVRFPICSALCVPIMHHDEILGVIYGDRVTGPAAAPYTAADVDFLAAVGQQVGVGLANLRLLADHMLYRQMQRDVEQAFAIQRRLLPPEPLRCGPLLAAGFNEPSAGVSGDYFDYVVKDDGTLGFIIADVVGHGLPAALLSSNLQAAVHVGLGGSVSLTDMVTRINRHVCRSTDPHVFITAILGVADPNRGEINFTCAGHPPPLVMTPDGVEELQYDGSLPLGLDENERFPVITVRPRSELRGVLFYTDGLTEAAAPSGELLGIERVQAALTTGKPSRAADIIGHLRQLVRQHTAGKPHADDLTLLAICRE